MNSGMNRLGLGPAQFRAAWARLDALPQVDEISLMTHFSDADGVRGIAEQFAVFNAACGDLPGERCLCNSAALLRFGDDALVGANAVEGGIAEGRLDAHDLKTVDSGMGCAGEAQGRDGELSGQDQ
jgi:alanine racemase